MVSGNSNVDFPATDNGIIRFPGRKQPRIADNAAKKREDITGGVVLYPKILSFQGSEYEVVELNPPPEDSSTTSYTDP